MKKLMLFGMLLLAVAACDCELKESAIADEKARVEDVLEKYFYAVEKEDYQMIENIWAEGDSTMMLGTDSNERLMGWSSIRDAYRRQFGLLSNTYISIHDQFIRVNCTGNTAWFSQRMNYNFIYDSVAHSFEGLRLTGVLVKGHDNNWKIVQGHLSIPAHVNIGNKP